MITFRGRCILLDIEGTTSSISFVYDVMFPFVRAELDAFLRDNWGDPQLAATAELIVRDATKAGKEAWQHMDPASQQAQFFVCQEVLRQMDADMKATGLKQLQGMIWKSGFESGQMQAHVYDDVVPALKRWHEGGIDLRIYSSGSVQAQLLFFGHSQYGNLLPFFTAHYDTKIGSKRESDSYRRIAEDAGYAPPEILFLSDVTAELDAATGAGLKTGLCVRPENPPSEGQSSYPVITSFADIAVTLSQ